MAARTYVIFGEILSLSIPKNFFKYKDSRI